MNSSYGQIDNPRLHFEPPLSRPRQTKVTHPVLVEAIAEALYVVSAPHLAAVCTRLEMGPPVDANDDPMRSKRAYITRHLAEKPLDRVLEIARTVAAEYGSADLENLLNLGGARGIDGELKNLIFAAVGRKPRIVLRDSINNVIEIIEGADRVLVYDRPLGDEGLSWTTLARWHSQEEHLEGSALRQAGLNLYARLQQSVAGNVLEERLLARYASLYRSHGFNIPALIPQVYLHYDPYARGRGGALTRQRMDFLLLLPQRRRVVLEIDGVHHYAEPDGRASTAKYANMAAEDRALRLAGYELYRFGGKEFADEGKASVMLGKFFLELLELDKVASGAMTL